MMRPLSPLGYGSSGSPRSHSIFDGLRTIAVLRIGAGLTLLLGYSLEATLNAWHFVWSHRAWQQLEALSKTALPFPQVLVPAAAFVSVTVAVAWILGFYTRLFSLVFIPLLLTSLIMVSGKADESIVIVCWLFLFIAITLVLHGSGNFSADALFRLAGGGSKKKYF